MTRYLPTTRHSTHSFFFFNDTAPTEIYTLSLHDALPICPGGALGVLRLEKLHVVEHLVGLVLGQRLQLALQPVTQDLVHGSVSSDMRSSTGLPRNRVRPARTRAVTWTVASGVRASSCARFASGTTTYTKPRSGSGPRASRYVAPFGMSGRSSSAFCTAMNCSVQRST